jgi:hypothetical protein
MYNTEMNVEIGSNPNTVAVVIPVYLPLVDGLELFSLQYSILNLAPGREVYFVCPETLDTAFYREFAPNAKFSTFDDSYFQDVEAYCKLLMSCHFYERFDSYDFILLTQADALVIRDDLDYWCNQGYDYIGAPWNPQLRVPWNASGANKIALISVGNGGFSLRRVKKCIELLNEFPDVNKDFTNIEDRFFAIYGFHSPNFSIPDRFVASKFSLEFSPDFFYELNCNCLPMGTHAWWKHDPEFWFKMLYPDLEPMRDLALKGFAQAKVERENGFKSSIEGLKTRLARHIDKALSDFED